MKASFFHCLWVQINLFLSYSDLCPRQNIFILLRFLLFRPSFFPHIRMFYLLAVLSLIGTKLLTHCYLTWLKTNQRSSYNFLHEIYVAFQCHLKILRLKQHCVVFLRLKVRINLSSSQLATNPFPFFLNSNFFKRFLRIQLNLNKMSFNTFKTNINIFNTI